MDVDGTSLQQSSCLPWTLHLNQHSTKILTNLREWTARMDEFAEGIIERWPRMTVKHRWRSRLSIILWKNVVVNKKQKFGLFIHKIKKVIVDMKNSIFNLGILACGFFLKCFFVLEIGASFEKLDFLTEISTKMTWQNAFFFSFFFILWKNYSPKSLKVFISHILTKG